MLVVVVNVVVVINWRVWPGGEVRRDKTRYLVYSCIIVPKFNVRNEYMCNYADMPMQRTGVGLWEMLPKEL